MGGGTAEGWVHWRPGSWWRWMAGLLGTNMPEKPGRQARAKGCGAMHPRTIGGNPNGESRASLFSGRVASKYSRRGCEPLGHRFRQEPSRQARIFRTKNASASRDGALHSMPRKRSSDQNASSLNHCRLALRRKHLEQATDLVLADVLRKRHEQIGAPEVAVIFHDLVFEDHVVAPGVPGQLRDETVVLVPVVVVVGQNEVRREARS